MTEFITWEFLATFAGSVAAVTLITQTIKEFINLDPKWIALVISIFVCALVQVCYYQDYSLQGIALACVNVFVVLAASIGGYETILKQFKKQGE